MRLRLDFGFQQNNLGVFLTAKHAKAQSPIVENFDTLKHVLGRMKRRDRYPNSKIMGTMSVGLLSKTIES